MWDHVVQRNIDYPVESVTACNWPIPAARVVVHQNKVSRGWQSHSCVIGSYM